MRTRTIRPVFLCAAVCTAILTPVASQAADVRLEFTVVRKPAVLFGGKPRPIPDFIRELGRRTVGRTVTSLRTPADLAYTVQASEEPDGRYRIDRAALSPVDAVKVSAQTTILYPKLSDAQYAAIRKQKDYRLVYGFIRGVVAHEELHARAFLRYVRDVRTIYAAPPIGENPLVAPREGETVADALGRFVDDRLAEALARARKAHTASQRAIDHAGKRTRVQFSFTEPVGDDLPSPFVYETEGKFAVSFAVPKNLPRPPEARTKY